MKISNSKKQLAQIIRENGGWCDGAGWAAQDKQYCGRKNNVALYDSKPPRPEKGDECWGGLSGAMIREFEAAELLPNWHQTILSRDEYFHLYPAPVEVVVENKTTCHLTVTDKPTLEQLAADYRNAKNYAERKQQEADAAKADADAKLAELVAAGKAHGLVLSVTDTGPELVITDWRDLRDGDEVECISPNVSPNKYRGRIGRLIGIDEHDSGTPYLVDFGECAKIWCHEVKFIRRPVKGTDNA